MGIASEAADQGRHAADWRNRHIAHRDFLLAVGRPTTPLPPADKQDIENALTAIVAVLNAVEEHYALTRSAIVMSLATPKRSCR